jgi:hypothetical protein
MKKELLMDNIFPHNNQEIVRKLIYPYKDGYITASILKEFDLTLEEIKKYDADK